MNLITCNKNCKHQTDGYCKLELNTTVSSSAADGCCYYKEKDEQKKNDSPKGFQ